MKKLKIAIIDFVTQKPVLTRILLLISALVIGISHPWSSSGEHMEISSMGISFLLGFSIVLYTFLFTLYRIFQKLFKMGKTLPDRIRNYDERNLARIMGFYWFLPFGGCLIATSLSATVDEKALGVSFMIQGGAIVIASLVSQVVKK